jgi:hypothetical protein
VVAAGSGEVVVIVRVTGTVKEALTETSALSVTLAVKLALTADDGGVPLKSPAEFKVSHDGKPVADQVLPPVPPPAVSVWL